MAQLAMMPGVEPSQTPKISITPLLKRLWPKSQPPHVTADEIALAVSHIFSDQLSLVQTGALLTALHFAEWDLQADVIAKCAQAMRAAAVPVDLEALDEMVRERRRERGGYRGGLCDVVGTGGDDHSTFNISTTASILASALLVVSKHGNRAATSKSGAADVLNAMAPTPPNIAAVTPQTLREVYQKTNYAFLFAPVFHPGMKYVATVRKELGWRTIFNLLGPLANPVEGLIEARVIGVARRELGATFAEALRMGGSRKALVVCGAEDLDEISCAGPTFCWRLTEKVPSQRDGTDGVEMDHFTLSPPDFGLPIHPLSEVAPGRMPHENAVILSKLLQNQLDPEDPILHFVLMNTAALFVVAGVCDTNPDSHPSSVPGAILAERGPGGGRWKEGVRLARWAVESGAAWRSWSSFVQVSNSFEG
ncbi:MAG: anthranilate phosphoribosyltransferase [Thelocarpon superellum]|nr:MAG: anthranilate phosphoribosyltransferase [Thelocarpon superellum]